MFNRRLAPALLCLTLLGPTAGCASSSVASADDDTQATAQQRPPPTRNATDASDAAAADAKPGPAAAQALRFFTGFDRIHTGTDSHADGIVVDADGDIASLWRKGDAVPQGAKHMALSGGFLVPGLHDAHIHLEGVGRKVDEVDLLGVRSPEEAKLRIADYIAAHPGVAAVVGRGWDQSLFTPPRFPTLSDLNGFSVPVAVRRVDGHALWANDVAMRLAAVDDKTKTPAGGEILKDKKGNPTGVFVDDAMTLVQQKLPAPSPADRRRWLVAGLDACARAGLVAIHDMGMSRATFSVLQLLDREGRVPLRVFVYLDGDDDAAYALLDTPPTPRVEVRGVKLYADGALGSRGALLQADYADRKGHRGLALTSPKLLEERVRRAHAAGRQAAIHAIGDGGVSNALTAIAGAQGSSRTVRHRIEHAQVIAPADFAAFSALGVVASMQPTHATSDMRWALQRLGPERIKGAYAWRTVLNNDIPLAFGSDAPVEKEDVRLGLHAAILRRDLKGQPDGGWRSEEALTTTEALAAFSAGAAFAVGREASLGRLVPGAPFDATVFSGVPAERGHFADVSVKATLVAGTPVFVSAPLPRH